MDTTFILSLFNGRAGVVRRQYSEFVQEGIGASSPFDDAKHKLILGSPQFVMEMWEQNSDAEEIVEVNKQERMIGRPTLEELFDEDMTKSERDDAILLARLRCGYSVSDIARQLKIHRTTVSNILSQKEKTLQQTTFYHRTTCEVRWEGRSILFFDHEAQR